LMLLKREDVTHIVVEHKDRLARFGVEYIKLLCELRGVKLIIVNKVEDGDEDIIQDFVSVITSFCARIYGKRRSKRKTELILKELNEE
jgi:predicted site-specific integrase-resolvase